jgi:two-component system probable response regulator PhcQ
MYRILLVDEDLAVTTSLARLLRYTPIVVLDREWRPHVEAFTSPIQALARMHQCGFDLALSGFHMAEMDGVALLRRFHELQPDAARVLVSSYADLNGLVSAINEARIDRFIIKPWQDFDLVSTLGNILERRALRLANQMLAQQIGTEAREPSPVERETRRLELLEPGITQVQWGPDGSVVMDPRELEGTPAATPIGGDTPRVPRAQ